MRTTCGVLLLLLNCVTGIALAAQLEVGVDRPGGDYRVIELPAPNPQLCAAQCEQDGRCLAFSYVKPGVQAPNARCWLKDELRTPVRGNPAAISGVMRGGAQPQRNPNYEYDTDRPGSDYANFDLQAANPDLCAAACTQDGRCRAWTYVRPGAQGPNPRCWLKSQVPNPVQSVFKAISGVKRTAGAAPPTTAGNLPPVVGTPPTSGPGAPQRPPGQGGQGGQGQGQPPVTTPPSTRPGGTGTFPPPGPTPGPTVSPGQAVYVLQGVRVSDPYQNIKRFVRVDDMKYDTRGGEVRVTGLDDGECAPMRGTPSPGVLQRFRYTWQFSEDVRVLRPGQIVQMNMAIDGDRHPCLLLNPHMTMQSDDNLPSPNNGQRLYFDPAGEPFHVGGPRRFQVLSNPQQLGKTALFRVTVTGLRGHRGMAISFEYHYVLQKP